MLSLEELLAISVDKMTNPVYVGFVVMILMQFIGKAGLDGAFETITKRAAEDWKRRSFFVNAITLILTLGVACAAVNIQEGYSLEQAILVGIVALPVAIGEYELVKNVLGAFGYKRH